MRREFAKSTQIIVINQLKVNPVDLWLRNQVNSDMKLNLHILYAQHINMTSHVFVLNAVAFILVTILDDKIHSLYETCSGLTFNCPL